MQSPINPAPPKLATGAVLVSAVLALIILGFIAWTGRYQVVPSKDARAFLKYDSWTNGVELCVAEGGNWSSRRVRCEVLSVSR